MNKCETIYLNLVEVFVFVFVHVYKHVFILEKQVNQLKSSVQAAGDGSICTCKKKIGRCLYLCIGGHIGKASVSPWQVYQLQSSVQAAGDGGIVTVLGGSIHHPYATPIPHTIYAFLNSK